MVGLLCMRLVPLVRHRHSMLDQIGIWGILGLGRPLSSLSCPLDHSWTVFWAMSHGTLSCLGATSIMEWLLLPWEGEHDLQHLGGWCEFSAICMNVRTQGVPDPLSRHVGICWNLKHFLCVTTFFRFNFKCYVVTALCLWFRPKTMWSGLEKGDVLA